MRKRGLAIPLALLPGAADAHASEQGLVLLLPTDFYIAAGTASVAATVLLLAALPDTWVSAAFRSRRVRRLRPGPWLSWLSFVLMLALIWTGLTGPRDPRMNALPLSVWTVGWIGFTALVGLLGTPWARLNPWRGPVGLLRALGIRTSWHLPAKAAPFIALAGFMGFAAFQLADPAPSDPARLARLLAAYWFAVLLGALAYGPRFLAKAEIFAAVFTCFGRTGLFHRERIGLPGWQILTRPAPPLGLAILMVALLGTGSFDGLNETFWWLGHIGINPLEFPGRSAVIAPTLIGLIASNLILLAAFTLCLKAGLLLSGGLPLKSAFRTFAPTLLPIALGYHVAHYLTALLVDGQYALVAASDPFARGWDLLGLGEFYVTTGFFNTQATVRVIFLAQAGAVVLGHILSIVLAHGLARRHLPSRRALLSQLPLAAFMVAYTLFGLWLLAAPRGA
ncbi:MAG: hypothetical protein KDK24_01220 [Pseudooceanicola sp.]|nr:hypothetical protein [Pseudooceanicola sp.]